MQTALIGALNGVIGDYLRTSENPLEVKLGFYRDDQPVAGPLDGLTTDSSDRWSGDLCIFVHGAAGSERAWFGKPSDQSPENAQNTWSFGEQLSRDFGIRSAYIRYNSGLHISENGKAMAALWEAHLTNPRIKRIFVIGHSMGGLLFRSACHYADRERHSWIHKVEQAYYLGSPHLGAPLEKFGAWTQSILSQVDSPYTQLAAKLINIRSNGIKDLRHGYLIDEEWTADEEHTFPVNNRRTHFHLERARHLIVAGTIHQDPRSLTAKWFGDIMVRPSSALSDCPENRFNLPVDPADVFITGGHHHIKLMKSPKVYGFIREKISESRD